MSEPKLYRNNKSGKVVAASYNSSGVFVFDGTTTHNHRRYYALDFEKDYTALPEAPEVGSTAWAFDMASRGKTVFCEVSGKKCHLQNFGHTSGQPRFVLSKGKEIFMAINPKPFGTISSEITWKLYEEPKPIIEKPPHEFMKNEKVLVRSLEGWSLGYFKGLNYPGSKIYIVDTKSSFGVCSESRCLPYAGNEHLEGTFIGEHEYGAVPKGYVPPHTPRLGDDDYWALNDEVIDLSRNEFYKIHCKTKNNEYFYAKNQDGESIKFRYDGVIEPSKMRVMFHAGSGVNDDGTVNETAPTRPHKIREGE